MFVRLLSLIMVLVLTSGCVPMTAPVFQPGYPVSPQATTSDPSTDRSVDASDNSPADTSTTTPNNVSSEDDSSPVDFESTSTPDSSSDPNVPALQVPLTFSFPLSYDFAQPIPECLLVDNSYFADAAFVGDSRTEGFWLYSKVKQGTLISYTGLTVFGATGAKVININGRKGTVLEALSTRRFSKIYLAFGVNELGYRDPEAFYRTYCRFIDSIRAAQPNAIIYIQTIIPVNDQRAAATGHMRYVNCSRVREFNEVIRRVAHDKQIPLLDIYSFFVVDDQLPLEASRDGVHLVPDYCVKQLEFYCSHAIPTGTYEVTPPAVAPVEPAYKPVAKPAPSVPSTPAPAEPPAESDVPAEPSTPVPPADPDISVQPDAPVVSEPPSTPETPVVSAPSTAPEPPTETESEVSAL